MTPGVEAHRPSGTDVNGEVKRRRANVLFVLVLTTICAGLLAATTDSKAMVYVFALAMLALGGYVYLLVTMNQRTLVDARGYEVEFQAPQPQRRPAPSRRCPDPPRRRSEYDFDDLDEYEGYDRPARQAPARQRRVVAAAGRSSGAARRRLPRAGVSGRISYGRRAPPVTRMRCPIAATIVTASAGSPGPRATSPCPGPQRPSRHGQQQAVRRRHYSQAG